MMFFVKMIRLVPLVAVILLIGLIILGTVGIKITNRKRKFN